MGSTSGCGWLLVRAILSLVPAFGQSLLGRSGTGAHQSQPQRVLGSASRSLQEELRPISGKEWVCMCMRASWRASWQFEIVKSGAVLEF